MKKVKYIVTQNYKSGVSYMAVTTKRNLEDVLNILLYELGFAYRENIFIYANEELVYSNNIKSNLCQK